MQLELLAVVATGVAAGSLASLLIGLAGSVPASAQYKPSHYDVSRRARLRITSILYRAVAGWIERLAAWNQRSISTARLDTIACELKSAAISQPWRPEEYLAVVQLQSVAAALFGFGFGAFTTGSATGGILFAVLAAWGLYALMMSDPTRKAATRRRQLKERLPFTIDLMAQMMAAGATFQECLNVAVAENVGHPLGEELSLVVQEMNMGRTRREAVLALLERAPDPDISELVFAIVKGEEMGTPLSAILRTQADQIRLKYSQTQEKESAEAQVAILFPGMIIMIACLLIIVAPFVLQAWQASAGSGGIFD